MSPAVLFATAAAAGAAATLAVRWAGLRAGLTSPVNPIVRQSMPRSVALLGGVGVMCGALAPLLATGPGGELPWTALLGGAAAFLVLGVVDDVRPLGAGAKLAGQAMCAVVALALGLLPSPSPLHIALALLWMLAVVNAVNVTDVCDGLVAGLMVVTLPALALARPELLPLALAFVGATAGFLLFNRPRASIYLGDAGSHLLGFVLAAGGLLAAEGLDPPHAAGWLLLVSAVPLFELAFVTERRLSRGLPWWRGSPDHFALRLQRAGLTRLQVDLCAWTVAALLAACAVGWHRLGPRAAWPLAAAAALLLFVVRQVLLRWEPSAVPPAETIAAEETPCTSH